MNQSHHVPLRQPLFRSASMHGCRWLEIWVDGSFASMHGCGFGSLVRFASHQRAIAHSLILSFVLVCLFFPPSAITTMTSIQRQDILLACNCFACNVDETLKILTKVRQSTETKGRRTSLFIGVSIEREQNSGRVQEVGLAMSLSVYDDVADFVKTAKLVLRQGGFPKSTISGCGVSKVFSKRMTTSIMQLCDNTRGPLHAVMLVRFDAVPNERGVFIKGKTLGMKFNADTDAASCACDALDTPSMALDNPFVEDGSNFCQVDDNFEPVPEDEAKSRPLNMRDNVIAAAVNATATLENRIRELESKRGEIDARLADARARLATVHAITTMITTPIDAAADVDVTLGTSTYDGPNDEKPRH